MKKETLMKIQKWVCILLLITAIITCVGAFCFVNESMQRFNTKEPYTINFFTYYLGKETRIPGYSTNDAYGLYVDFWLRIQSANSMLFYTGIFTLICVAVFAILGGFNRRHYYKSNLICGIVTGAVAIVLSIVTIIETVMVYSYISTIQPDIAEGVYDNNNNLLTFTFGSASLGIILPIILIVVSGLFIAFVVVKFKKTYFKGSFIEATNSVEEETI